MGKATLVTLLTAAVLFAAMGWVRSRFDIGHFRFGTDWSHTEAKLKASIDVDPGKAPLMVVPLLFPLDLLFLIFFGVGLALCSMTYAGALSVPPNYVWLLLILPILYMVADLSENILYSGMLVWQHSIPHLIDAGRLASRVKWVAVALAMLQALGAFALSWRH